MLCNYANDPNRPYPIMDKFFWCSKGFTPEDVANRKCLKYNRNSFGCSRCRDFKLMSLKEIEELKKMNEYIPSCHCTQFDIEGYFACLECDLTKEYEDEEIE